VRPADPASVDVDRSILDGPLSRLLEANATRAAALVVGGRLVWERYWHGAGPATRFDTYSIGKAFTAATIGLLAADGALSLDDRASRFLPEWEGDARRDITIRHLLTMTSGLALHYDRFMAAPDATAATRAWPLMHRPGTTWSYEQATAHALVPIITRVTGRQPIDILRERVLLPMGAPDVGWARTGSGDCKGWRSVLASARDLCRFGELLLGRGRWKEKALLDAKFVGRMTAVDPVTAAAVADPPAHDSRRRGYGFLAFVNAGGLWPGVDPDAFALLGAFGNVCLVDPRHDFVFVRLVTPEGHDEDDDATYGNALDVADRGTARLWRAVLRAFGPAGAIERLRRRIDGARLDARGAIEATARQRGLVG
jgi:CubicO group peptidase (beta-lactamase class C family)